MSAMLNKDSTENNNNVKIMFEISEQICLLPLNVIV